MPTYAYACTACQHRFEMQQAFTEDALTECPECAGRLRKVFSSVGIVFKGSGFYRTDSRAKDGAGSAAGATEKKEEAQKQVAATVAAAASAASSDGRTSAPASASSSSSGSSASSTSSAA
jgi:putative FmdB family regulatory protein